MQAQKTATYYEWAPGVVMLTCWNEAKTNCGCQSISAEDLPLTIEVLTRNGYAVSRSDAAPILNGTT